MSLAYVGEIRMFGFTRVPQGWLVCDGSLQAIAQYQTLYALLGTTYGGDGQNTFAVPDLRGRLPIHQGQGTGLSPYTPGQIGGTEQVTVLSSQMPAHTHIALATSAAATSLAPGPSLLLAAVSADTFYANNLAGAVPIEMSPASTTVAGGNQAHENCMPTLTVRFCIAAEGIYPSRD